MCEDSRNYKKRKWYVLEVTETQQLSSSLTVCELNLSEKQAVISQLINGGEIYGQKEHKHGNIF